ncbi:MAG: adenine phosphoribosyltransferase [Ignavibacteriaceae bacterium]|nr:adenine phosphoribosyltransferase [Ignavibacteriaceae bacterium]
MAHDLKKYIREVQDFPKKGISFKDVTTLLKEPEAINETLKQLLAFAKDLNVTKVVGIESRGFIFGAMLAEKLNAGFIPIRKPGKLPAETESITYALEYGTDTIEIHKDAIKIGERVLLHDDLLATGGTAKAAAKLIERLGGEVVQISFVVELTALKGREKLKNYDVRSLVEYEDEE